MSETPRTDALMGKMLGATRKLDGPLSSASNLSTLVAFARRLERERAEAHEAFRRCWSGAGRWWAYRIGLLMADKQDGAALTEAVRSDAEDAAKWREHAEVMRLSGLDDALLIRLVMRENGTVWSNVHVIDVGRFGRKTILGLKAIGLCAEAQAEKLFNAMERTDMNNSTEGKT